VKIDYNMSIDEVYQEAVHSMAVNEQHLMFWRGISRLPKSRLALGMASWAPCLHTIEDTPLSGEMGIYSLFHEYPMSDQFSWISIEENIMTVHGFIFDTVQSVAENFTDANIAGVPFPRNF
jgi:hypothetical protein